jgi:hypothetical protein
MYNIFQGNDLINNCIIEGLKLEKTDRVRIDSQEYYFQAFFYLTKRFGMPKIYDDYKDGGVWTFNVKEFKIQILLDSVFVNFMIFGNSKFIDYSNRRPYWVAYRRKSVKVKDKLFTIDYSSFNSECPKLTKIQQKTNEDIWDKFCNENNIDDTWNDEKFKKEGMSIKWHDYIEEYNRKIVGVEFEDYEKFGTYSNSSIKYALKILTKFLNNMLSPIWVRDCDFNILGRGGSEYEKYGNNIKIDFNTEM